MFKTILQHNKQFFSNNLAIIGKTGCGKTTLLQSLLVKKLELEEIHREREIMFILPASCQLLPAKDVC